MIDGILNLSLLGYIFATLILTHITIASVTIFLHRHQAHRALELHPLVSHFFRFWLWITTGMITREWVAIHRKHHAKCETVDDPHSPQVKGIRKVLWQGAELYREEANNSETLKNFGQGTPNDWLENHVYKYSFIGISLMLAIDLILFGIAGISIWAIQMLWIPFWAAGVINGIGHYWGYRNYECTDASRNILPWGILIGGEELHNNHHTYASSAKLSSKWWEFDIGWFYIKLLSYLHLAQIKRVAPQPNYLPAPKPVNDETLSAILTNRFQIMARYSREVIATVNKEIMASADKHEKSLLKQAPRLLTKEESLIDANAKSKLETLLEKYRELKIIYQFKQSLQALWQSSNRSNEKLLQQLEDWCKRAESSGIQALENFARQLGYYSLQPAR